MTRCRPDSCKGCAIYAQGTDFSRVDGTGANGVMLVGEASGEMEARDGLPFRPYAPAGSLLERTFRRMGMDRSQFSITNILRCRPRNNWLEGAPWEYSSINHCRSNLEAAIADRRPRAIVALGGTALRELTGMVGTARGIGHLAGYVLPLQRRNDDIEDTRLVDSHASHSGMSGVYGGANTNGRVERAIREGIPVIGNYHPAFLRRGKASLQGLFARILNRATLIAAGKDHAFQWGIDPADRTTHGQLIYRTHPSLEEAGSYLRRVRDGAGAVVSYDIETFESASLDEDAREGFVDTNLRLIQFSLESGEGIALPWEGGYREIARDILHTPNTKCGHNVWLFDNKVLRAAGEREGLDLIPRGVIHDTLQMFHHWQPDLPAHLQFCAQFVSFPFPWKHLAGTDIEFYSCCDVDATLRLYTFLEAALRKDGLWGDATLGYLGQLHAVRPILAAMEDRGMPIDDPTRLSLDAEFTIAQSEIGHELDHLFPESERSVHPKAGYKREPKTLDGLVLRAFTDAGVDGGGNPIAITVNRYCRLEPFNPNSWQQLIRYMKGKGHKPPKGKQEDENGNAKDTTAKKELQRLAHRTGDSFYLRVIEYRELSKMRGTYIDGFAPHADSRVHTTFTFDTGTGQFTSRNPNIQNFPKHGRLAKAVRAMVAAPDGHVIVEADFKSYHVLTTGFEAEDAGYMRMARLDMHSFVAGCFLNLWSPIIMEESDDALMDRFKWLKGDVERKRVRDKQAKPSILGIGFGMGYRRLYQENLEHFDGEKTARKFHDLLRGLFPKVFAWQDRIRQQAHRDQFLRSRFGHLRRFYEVFTWKNGALAPGDQAEEAVAFLPANHAFGSIRECMKEQRARGLDDRFGLCNNVHDSFVYVFRREMLDEFLAEVIPVLRAPSRVLTHPILAPNGLTVDVEVAAGKTWAQMAEIVLAKAAV